MISAPTPTLVQTFAPHQVLRAAINLGNPILANRRAPEQAPFGVSIDLAQALADTLGVALDLVVFDTAKASVEAVRDEQADVGFFALDPARSSGMLFSTPYVLIEGSYLVAEDSDIKHNEAVDQPGTTVVVGKGSAYDLFLTRTLAHAELVRAPSSPTVVDVFVQQSCAVAAGVKQQLQADLLRYPGHRLLPGRFMVIQQAMGTFASKGAAAGAWLTQFVEHQKSTGFVQQAMLRHGIQGASVAPQT